MTLLIWPKLTWTIAILTYLSLHRPTSVIGQTQQGGVRQHLEVVTIDTPPFVYKLEGYDEHGEKAEGYLIDVWKAIADKHHFSYRLHFVRDNKYGFQQPDGQWTGIIGELINRQAQVGLAALTITSQREQAVDFTYPFMKTGITALMKKPTGTYKGVGFGNLMELAALDNATYGIIKSGSTNQFFSNSKHTLYKKMGKIMNKHPENLPNSVKEGVEKVKSSDNFVFLGESTTLEFYAGIECDLMKLEEEINSIGYGIGFPKGDPLPNDVSITLLELQDKGVLQKLKQKWWVRKCPSLKLCACLKSVSSEESEEDLGGEGENSSAELFRKFSMSITIFFLSAAAVVSGWALGVH